MYMCAKLLNTYLQIHIYLSIYLSIFLSSYLFNIHIGTPPFFKGAGVKGHSPPQKYPHLPGAPTLTRARNVRRLRDLPWVHLLQRTSKWATGGELGDGWVELLSCGLGLGVGGGFVVRKGPRKQRQTWGCEAGQNGNWNLCN